MLRWAGHARACATEHAARHRTDGAEEVGALSADGFGHQPAVAHAVGEIAAHWTIKPNAVLLGIRSRHPRERASRLLTASTRVASASRANVDPKDRRRHRPRGGALGDGSRRFLEFPARPCIRYLMQFRRGNANPRAFLRHFQGDPTLVPLAHGLVCSLRGRQP